MKQEEKKTHLLKIGDSIMFSPSGIDYSFEKGITYEPKYDKYTEQISLIRGKKLQLPEKLYIPNGDDRFMNRVLKTYEDSSKSIGVLLTGTKGTGKTVMAKVIASKSNLPVIIADPKMSVTALKTLFSRLSDSNVCVIFDEFDKLGEDYCSDYLLQFIDGISTSGKHLILFTCNDTEKVNSYMIDRCGRIRYCREFKELSANMITELLKDRLNDKSEVGYLTDFILANFKLASFDNVASFVDEINRYPNDTFEELFDNMNISSKN